MTKVNVKGYVADEGQYRIENGKIIKPKRPKSRKPKKVRFTREKKSNPIIIVLFLLMIFVVASIIGTKIIGLW